MTAEEVAVGMLKADLTLRDDMEEGESGKDLQRKCLRIISPVTLIKVYCCVFIIAVLTASVVALSIVLSVREEKVLLERCQHAAEHCVSATCPESWIGFGSKCFYFSEDTRNWTFSQTFCTSLEAHLARFETLEELNFLKRYKGPSDHWIGLSRESAHHVWKWTDNTDYGTSYVLKLPFLLLCLCVVMCVSVFMR
ncbi:PREDICTED: C-type lectin domain family 2 member E-like [Propithecus coquereli]|uniref:C-type lectin domain family 2 member E-like n=1 Tax=Propithecus coquereli TaxID=379532 RepID=UPI00063F9E39|nr:PREDICTED: C-type lectin domain family 2 member E-like [Propithecus coquereli]